MRDRPSPNHDDRRGHALDMVVLHYTGMKSAAESLERLCDPAAKVSAHYLIEEDGQIWRLVPEDRRAWHAGVAFWAGERDINACSIGIELQNPGHEFGYRPFPEPQFSALVDLLDGIRSRHDIPDRRIVGHSDVAPARKMDPGELFPWKYLSSVGHGIWPWNEADTLPLVEDWHDGLARFGYEVGLTPEDDRSVASLTAFQRRFTPDRINGKPDQGTLVALTRLLRLIDE